MNSKTTSKLALCLLAVLASSAELSNTTPAILSGVKALEHRPLKCPKGYELKLRSTANTPLSNEGTLFAKARDLVVAQDYCDICDQLIRGSYNDGSHSNVLAHKCECSDCDFAVCQDCYTCYQRLARYTPSLEDLQNPDLNFQPKDVKEFLASPQENLDILRLIKNQYRAEIFDQFKPEELCRGWEKMRTRMYTTIDSSDSSLKWYINDIINKYFPIVSTLSCGLEKLHGKRHFGYRKQWVESSELLHIIERRFAFFWHTLIGSSQDQCRAAVEECQCKPDEVSDNHFWVKRPLGLASFAAVPRHI